jgi:hypothetical protein
VAIEKKSEALIEDEKPDGVSMIDIGAVGILTLLLIFGKLEAVTIVNHHSDDEYVLEHEVLREDALAEAKKLQIYPGKKESFPPSNNSSQTTYKTRKLELESFDISFDMRSICSIYRSVYASHRLAWKKKAESS